MTNAKHDKQNRRLAAMPDNEELEREATVSKKEIVQIEGNREVTRAVDFYNLGETQINRHYEARPGMRPPRHCEERGDEAIQMRNKRREAPVTFSVLCLLNAAIPMTDAPSETPKPPNKGRLDCRAPLALAMTKRDTSRLQPPHPFESHPLWSALFAMNPFCSYNHSP
jgi:hypothetical protein